MLYLELLEKMQLVSCISKAIQIAIENPVSVLAHFDISLLTIDNVELITSYLDNIPEIFYNFDSSSCVLNIRASTISEISGEVHCHVRTTNQNTDTNKYIAYVDETNKGIIN